MHTPPCSVRIVKGIFQPQISSKIRKYFSVGLKNSLIKKQTIEQTNKEKKTKQKKNTDSLFRSAARRMKLIEQ